MVSQAVKRASLEELGMEFDAIGHELVDGDLQSLEVRSVHLAQHPPLSPDAYRAHSRLIADQVHRVRMRLAFLLTNASREVQSVKEALGSVSADTLRFFGFYQ